MTGYSEAGMIVDLSRALTGEVYVIYNVEVEVYYNLHGQRTDQPRLAYRIYTSVLKDHISSISLPEYAPLIGHLSNTCSDEIIFVPSIHHGVGEGSMFIPNFNKALLWNEVF